MPEPMRVLQICAGFSLETLGGVERYTFDLSRALHRRGVQVSIAGLWRFGTEHEQIWMQRLNAEGIDTFAGALKDDRAPMRNFRDSIAQLRRQLAGHSFDVIHSQQEFGDVAAMLLKSTTHAPVLVRSVHNDPEWRTRPLRRLLLTNMVLPAMFQAERGISRQIADRLNSRPLARLLGRRGNPIHNAIDLSRFADKPPDRQEARRLLDWPAEAYIVGSVGRLTEQKGYLYLVRAAAQLRQHLPQVRFHIVGAGELQATLQHEINALGLNDIFRLDGPCSHMNHVYAGMDLFASSSLWEGLPTVILEAMSAGVPVVGTAVDGTTDLVTDGESGWLVAPQSPEALAKGLLAAINARPLERAAIIANARSVAAGYDINHVAGQWLEVYRQVTGHRSPAGVSQVNK